MYLKNLPDIKLMSEDIIHVIVVVVVLVYVFIVAWCAWYLSAMNKKKEYCDKYFKCIRKYNCFGDRVQEEPMIDYVEV
tara:strand:+ start:1751 stop:1984 length:234 start_codon:yes stop_codon:yes gene_type:complete